MGRVSHRREAGRIVVLVAALAAVAGSAEAQGRRRCWQVTAVPTTLTTPGVYCVGRNLVHAEKAGTAITIAADDVVLDLRGHTLDGSPAGAETQAIGIGAVGRSNVTVTNGTVRGFHTAVRLAWAAGVRGNVVQGIRAEGNTVTGIFVAGTGGVIRGNLVLRTGGSALDPLPWATGIAAFEFDGGAVLDNDVVDTATENAMANDWCIWAANSNDVVIERNRVRNPTPSVAYTYGIIVPFSENAQIVENRISSVDVAIAYSSGATGKYRGNLTDGVAGTAFAGGTDAGGNN